MAVCLLAPLAVAAAWIPAREHYSNLDVALLLVLVVMAVGSFGSVPGAFVAAASAAWWFDFFDTKPYAQPTIARRPDLVTFIVLAVVGAIAGATSAAYARRRLRDGVENQDMARLRSVAELLATRSELVEVISAIAGEVRDSLGLSGCWFAAAGPGGKPLEEVAEVPVVTRQGSCLGGPAEEWKMLLPVWAQGDVLGHFVLEGSGRPPAQDRLVFALALADQAGAALAAHGTLPPPPDESPAPLLRVLPGLGGRKPASVRRRRTSPQRLSA